MKYIALRPCELSALHLLQNGKLAHTGPWPIGAEYGGQVLSRGNLLAQMSMNESQKKRAYLQRVVGVERGAF